MAINAIKQDEELKEMSKAVTLKRLFSYLLEYKGQLIIVLIIMIITIAIITVNPLIIEHAIDVNIEEGDINGLITLGILAVILNIIMVIGIKLRIHIMGTVSNKILTNIREELYEHLQIMSIHFFDSRPTGKLLARVIGDVNSLKEVLEDLITSFVPELCTVLAVTGIMIVKNYKLAFAAFITVPFLIVAMGIIEHIAHKRWQIHRKKSSNVNAFVHENFSGIRIVQSFTAEKDSITNFSQLLKEQRDSFIHAVVVADFFSPVIETSWAVGSVLLYFIGIKVLGVGTVGVGTLIAFSTYLSMFWSPIRNISNFYNKVTTNISAAERIFEILDIQPEIKDKEKAEELPKIQGKVTFDHVTFSYETEEDTGKTERKNVLEDVSFEIKPGETIALVGPTGAGKTTIVNLISRFYDVASGEVKIDNYNVESVTMESLRSQMGIMTQDNFLFSGTIKDNIRYGRLDATEEEIIEAAKAVHAHDFIMKLEHGYDTEISERGTKLSVGQRQLLAFARTMVSRPGILILDEATSNIDTRTEQLVQQGIETLLKGRTSFVIAHRLSTIKQADRIFVIDGGTIKEEGNHAQLMEKKGLYYQLQMVH